MNGSSTTWNFLYLILILEIKFRCWESWELIIFSSFKSLSESLIPLEIPLKWQCSYQSIQVRLLFDHNRKELPFLFLDKIPFVFKFTLILIIFLRQSGSQWPERLGWWWIYYDAKVLMLWLRGIIIYQTWTLSGIIKRQNWSFSR